MNKGQAAVEYLLMLVVVTFVALAAYQNLKKYLLDDPNSFVTSSIGSYERMFNASGDLRQSYKFFSLPR